MTKINPPGPLHKPVQVGIRFHRTRQDCLGGFGGMTENFVIICTLHARCVIARCFGPHGLNLKEEKKTRLEGKLSDD